METTGEQNPQNDARGEDGPFVVRGADQPGQADDSGASEIRSAIDAGVRVMIASIELPADGLIDEDQKRHVREQTLAIIKKYRVSYAELSRQLGNRCHPSILSQVLRGKYQHPDSDWIRRLNKWNESYVRRQESIRTEGLVITAIVLAIRALADYAKTLGCIVAGYGPAGIGKTEALKVAVSEDPSAAYVRLRSTHISPTAFLRLVAEAIHLCTDGGASRICDAIIARLKGTHRLLVIDEMHLADRRIYEAIRDIHDETGCPFLLAGTSEIYVKLKQTRSKRGEAVFDQFFSRVGWCLDLTRLATDGGGSRPLFTEQEIREIFRSGKVRVTRDGVSFLQALSCSVGLGCLRMARRVWEMACRVARQKDKPVDADMLRRALIEQAVPNGADASLVTGMIERTASELVALAG